MAGPASKEAEGRIILTAQNEVVQAAEAVKKDFREIRGEADKVTTSTEKVSTSMLTAKERAALFATGIEAGVSLLQRAVGVAGQLKDAIGEAAESIAIEERFGAVTQSIGGAASAMDRLNAASARGVNDTLLQQLTIQADTAGVGLGQLEELINSAAKAAIANGRNQEELTQQFVQGIADMSDGVFKAMGLQVDFGMEVGKTASELGVSADALSVNTKRQILLNAALRETGKAYGDVQLDGTISKVNELDAAIENHLDTLKRYSLFLVEGFVAGIDVASSAFEDFLSLFEDEEPIISATIVMEKKAAELRARDLAAATEKAAAEEKKLTQARQDHNKLLRDTVAELARAKQAQLDQALALARTATQMGQTAVAAEKYAVALKLVDGAGVAFIDREALKREAIRETSKEFRKQLELMIEFETWNLNARKDAGLINEYEYNVQLARIQTLTDRVNDLNAGLSETVSAAVLSPTAEPRGPKRPRRAPTQRTPRRGRDDSIEERRAGRGGLDDGSESLAAIEAEQRALQALSQHMDSVARSSLNMAEAMSASFGGVGAAVANASDIIVSQTTQIVSMMDQFKKAGLDSTDAFIGAVPGMISASGQLAAGFVGDEQTKAAIMAAVETAAAIASFATQDYVGGGMHLLSAAMYGAVAGGAYGAGGGAGAGAGGGGAGRFRPPQVNEPPPSRQRSDTGTPIQITIQGANFFGSSERQAGRDLRRWMSRTAGVSSSDSPNFAGTR